MIDRDTGDECECSQCNPALIRRYKIHELSAIPDREGHIVTAMAFTVHKVDNHD